MEKDLDFLILVMSSCTASLTQKCKEQGTNTQNC